VTPEFLDREDALAIHAAQLGRFGGPAGVRDMGLLESALAQASATFRGKFLHPDLFEMAAADLFHIVANHPFVDGNKRTGLICALTFLRINGIVFEKDDPAFEQMAMSVAKGAMSKCEIAEVLRALAISE
jgi:death-on-curing protein